VQTAGSALEVASSAAGTTFSFVLALAEEVPSVSATAVVTIGDARLRALSVALLRAAGCDVVSELPEDHAGAAIWVTEQVDELERCAGEFAAGAAQRQVFLVADEADGVAGVCAVTLTGPRGLAVQVRRFLTQLPAAATES
jgi:hypothetical protein